MAIDRDSALELKTPLQVLRQGMIQVAPATPGIVLFGAGFGAAASAQGIDVVLAMMMSALVFAGAAQLAAIEIWNGPDAAVLVLLTVLGVNARHIVLGATMGGRLKQVPRWQCLAALALLSDVNWAATMTSVRQGKSALLHMVGGGIALWIAWVAGTTIGGLAGLSVGAVESFGIDALMPAFFACLLIGQMQAARPWSKNRDRQNG